MKGHSSHSEKSTSKPDESEEVSAFRLSNQKVPLSRVQNNQTVGVLVIINLNSGKCALLQTVLQASNLLCAITRFSTFEALELPLNSDKTRKGEQSLQPIDQMVKACTHTHNYIVQLIVFDSGLNDQLMSCGYPLSPIADSTSIDLSRLTRRLSTQSSTSPQLETFTSLPAMPPPLELPPMPPSLAHARGRRQ